MPMVANGFTGCKPAPTGWKKAGKLLKLPGRADGDLLYAGLGFAQGGL